MIKDTERIIGTLHTMHKIKYVFTLFNKRDDP